MDKLEVGLAEQLLPAVVQTGALSGVSAREVTLEIRYAAQLTGHGKPAVCLTLDVTTTLALRSDDQPDREKRDCPHEIAARVDAHLLDPSPENKQPHGHARRRHPAPRSEAHREQRNRDNVKVGG